MKNWKKLCLMLGTLSCCPLIANPTPPDIKRRITLSLGYEERFNSNEGMMYLPLTTIQGYSWAFDQATKITEGTISRTTLVLADLILHMPYLGKSFHYTDSNWFLKEKWWPYLPAIHEFGHARASRAFSAGSFKGYDITVNDETISSSSVLSYYIHSLKHLGFNEAAITHVSLDVTPARKLAIYGGGLNNESRLAKEISNWIYRFNGHIAYFGPYLRGKYGAVSYTSKCIDKIVNDSASDIGHAVSYYKMHYPDFSMENIKYGGLVSLLCSSTTYAFLKGYWDFIQTGNPTVKTFTLYGFRLPDVNFYFTRNGLSLEVISAYQVNPNLWVNLGVETVYYPKRSIELTPGIRYVIVASAGTFDFDAGVVINGYGHFSGHVGVEWTPPVSPITLQLKIIHHNANTYVGERNIPHAIKSDHDVEVMVSGSFNY